MIHDFEEIANDVITSVAITPDSCYALITSNDLHMRQYDLNNYSLVNDYGKIHERRINCVRITPDGLSAYTISDDQHLKEWS